MLKKYLIILFFIALSCKLAYSSELLSKEALTHYNEGVRAQMRGDFDTAKVSYQKSVLLGAKYKKFALNNFGIICANRQESDKAEAAFKEALEIDPAYQVAAFNLSLLYLKLSISYKDKGDTKRALDYLELALSYYPEKSFIMEKEKEETEGQ